MMDSQNNQPLSADLQNRIQKFLKALPHLELSDKGLQNVANKFGVTVEAIQQVQERLMQ